MASSKREACVRATCARPHGSHGRGLRRPARPVDSACTLYTCTLSAAAFAGMLALDVGVPGTDPMWHMYHWRGSVDTRGTARPGLVGCRVHRPAPRRGNDRTPCELWGLAPETANVRIPQYRRPKSGVGGVAVVWLWIRVTVSHCTAILHMYTLRRTHVGRRARGRRAVRYRPSPGAAA